MAHLISVILVMQASGILNSVAPWYLLIIGILAIGTINAYNFMDGINGITGLYSLAIFVPLYISETNGQTSGTLELFTIMALLIFNYFNTRKKAICFAGDIGSISLALIVVFLLIMRIKMTGKFEYIGLLLIYGIDSVYTIMQRLYHKENIFRPHRKHLYQYLCNEKRFPHLIIKFILCIASVYK